MQQHICILSIVFYSVTARFREERSQLLLPALAAVMGSATADLEAALDVLPLDFCVNGVFWRVSRRAESEVLL